MQLSVVFCVAAALAPAQAQLWNELSSLGNEVSSVGSMVSHTFTGEEESKGCDCDCCQVSQRYPAEVERLSTNEKLEYKCIHTEPSSSVCPAQCTAKDRHDILEKKEFVEKGSIVDYSRYCLYNCRPAYSVVGSACLSAGSGAPGVPGPLPHGGGMFGDHELKIADFANAPGAADAGAPAGTVAEELSDAAKEAMKTKHVTWDLRPVLAERVRAEAAAATARGIAAGERIKMSDRQIERDALNLNKIGKVIATQYSSIEPEFLLVKANATDAGDYAAEAFKTLQLAKAEATQVAQRTRELAAKLIAEAAKPAAAHEAETYAKRMHWGESADNRQVVAQKVGAVYAAAASTAGARTNEYTVAAEGYLKKERELEVAIKNKDNAIEKMTQDGDRLGANVLRRQVRRMRQQLEEAKANKEASEATSKKAAGLVNQFQVAGQQAADRAAYLYDYLHQATPPPPPMMEVAPPPSVWAR
eukprot:TRINITY_DN1975_c4_g1_i1.p1 TRINITY_DN1975_c4_g1~~TRINITY_DN1975_c4_g1_i1.p1  ORF type:complete len:473 (-),score=149.14 TRINITY_DN1975_c4_g1_i1:143-1561(-)